MKQGEESSWIVAKPDGSRKRINILELLLYMDRV